MKQVTITTSHTLGKPQAESAIVHTQTSCYLIETEVCRISGQGSSEVAKLIMRMHRSIVAAEAFITGFEDDEDQEGIPALLSELRAFDYDLKKEECHGR